ncbi:MAG: FecR family protein [Thermodesulfobacteriota bacterium]
MAIIKKGGIFFVIFLSVAFNFLNAQALAQSPISKEERGNAAKITFLQGKAEVLSAQETSWKLLQIGSFLYPEDEIKTHAKSRLEIQFPDRSIMRFDEHTTFKLKRVLFAAPTNSRDIKVEIVLGKSWANVRKIFSSKKTFEVASANAVAGVRDTIWRMNIGADKTTLIRVYEGAVQVYNPFVRPEYKLAKEGFKSPQEVSGPQEVPPPYHEISREEWEEIVLQQMMQVVIPAVGKPSQPSRFNIDEDLKEEWVRWNKKRDRELRKKN